MTITSQEIVVCGICGAPRLTIHFYSDYPPGLRYEWDTRKIQDPCPVDCHVAEEDLNKKIKISRFDFMSDILPSHWQKGGVNDKTY